MVVLLHGTPSPANDWLPLASLLASRYRVLIPDLPGGYSTGVYRAFRPLGTEVAR